MLLFSISLKGMSQDSTLTVVDSVKIDTAASVTSNSGDESYDFKEAGQPAAVDGRKIPAARLQKIKSDDDYWYINEVPVRPKKNKQVHKPQNFSWLNTMIWIFVIVALVSLLIWFLATGNVGLFRRSAVKILEETGEHPIENIFETNFNKEIQKAVSEQNYRLAVRLLYVRTLRQLSDHNLIDYRPEKTNSDYLFQLAGTKYYQDFFKLTRNFDYTWYGQFQLTQDNFSIIQNQFSSFQNQLS